MNDVIAYHFCGDTLRDGRPIPADGEWLTHDGNVVMCASGLHASRHPFDALQYAPGPILCRVECEDGVTEHDDKLVCRRRRIIKRIDATDLCWQAARRYALDVIHLWDAPAVVRQYLQTGDETLSAAAREAARAAAWAAAWGAARDAAWAAAWAAERAWQLDHLLAMLGPTADLAAAELDDARAALAAAEEGEA